MHIVLMILGFVWWWPVGLAMLAFILMRRRRWRQLSAAAGEGAMFDGNYGMQRWERKMARAQEKVERVRNRMDRYAPQAAGWFTPSPATSGNAAFDEYRNETLKRLEEEQREFKSFLDQLRVAKDRAEFDAFMNDRRRAQTPDAAPPAPPAPQG